ncbi:RIP metalloprotease RseP [candidate division KSB1 bacterium]|nr:RIP metalloprotease RseP [candidate division KSB1 bacterium]
MENLLSILIHYILPAIPVFAILVIFHELGHFVAAKAVGIRVERFSLGFPPRLFGKKVGDTDYCISALPLGGYVKMAGMIDESMDNEGIKGEPDEFMSKSIWQRMLVIAAGPIFNILLTVFIITGMVYNGGVGVTVGPVVGAVGQNSPAETAGLLPGDRVVTIDGMPVESWEVLARTIHGAKEQPLLIEWERAGQMFQATITPQYDPVYDSAMIGIAPKTVAVPVDGFFQALGIGFSGTWNNASMILRSFGLMIGRKIGFRDNVAGPVKIVQIIGESARMGFSALLSITALISLSLGLINLFPIPALDGGHLLLLLGEAVKRKPISVKTRLVWQQVGMALLLALMFFVILNDFFSLI